MIEKAINSERKKLHDKTKAMTKGLSSHNMKSVTVPGTKNTTKVGLEGLLMGLPFTRQKPLLEVTVNV